MNEANTSNPSPGAPFDFPTVFPHDLSPLTYSHITASAGRIVEGGCTSQYTALLSKQGTSDATSSRTGSARFITISPCKKQMEKKTVVQSTDKGKKLNCLKSLYETRYKQ
jgi:hypothetical protein